MGDVLIRGVPEAMKRAIAKRAERHGNSLSDEAKLLLGKALMTDSADEGEGGLSAWDALRPILADETDEFARTMDEIEAERKKDFGRPAQDFE